MSGSQFPLNISIGSVRYLVIGLKQTILIGIIYTRNHQALAANPNLSTYNID